MHDPDTTWPGYDNRHKEGQDKSAEVALLAKHGSVYEILSYLRKEWDGMPDEVVEPLLERLYTLLLPPEGE